MISQERWNKWTTSTQMVDIGGELKRACDNFGTNPELCEACLTNALLLLQMTKMDPKNANPGRQYELAMAGWEIEDFFHGGNTCNNTIASLMQYWDWFVNLKDVGCTV